MITTMFFALLLLVPSTSMAQTVVMGEYETQFSFRGKSHASRAANIELAATLLDGAIIAPGTEWSFNQEVGPRNERHGFRKAKVIFKRRLRKDFGGGVCQVASTLHAAALNSGLHIVEHTPHSRVSSYIHASLDATVVWPNVDLRIRNPYPFPVTVDTSIREGISEEGKPVMFLKVSMWGKSKPNVSVHFQVHETTEFETLTLFRNDWKAGKRRVQEPGSLGYKLTRTRVFARPDRSYVEEYRDFDYPPSRRIIIKGISSTP
jgi:hypothetical protein